MLDLEFQDIPALFSSSDYTRGMQYYRQKRVSGMTETVSNGLTRVDCTVRGTQTYQVMFRESPGEELAVRCTCPRFQDVGICKHLAAAMIAYVKGPAKSARDESDGYAQQMLRAYIEKEPQHEAPEEPAMLVPRIGGSSLWEKGYPTFTFRVGRGKLYAVKNVKDFLDNVARRKTVALGKQLTLDHSIGQFDQDSQALIGILMNEFEEFRSVTESGYYKSYYSSYSSSYRKNEIVLRGDSFDRLFSLLEGRDVDAENGGTMQFRREDPRITVHLQKEGDGARLLVQTWEPCRFFGSHQSLYAMGQTALLKCSEAFRDRVYPMLSVKKDSMRLSLQDLPSFCGCVLPEIEDLVTVEDPDALLREYLPEECTPCFYFDMEDDSLTLRLTFRYGDKELPAESGQDAGVRRDVRAESRASAFARRYFRQEGQQYYLTGEDAVYDFLTDGIHRFQEQGQVFISDRLQGKRIAPSQASVGISVSDGLLNLELDTGDFPPEELEALYQSLLRRKKYHRLQDGRFLSLDGSSYEKLAEMAHMLQLSPKELGKGSLRVPAFRGLYLDSILAGSDDLRVTRDRQFRSMIRNFKSVRESDYSLPEHLEGVLRPYQKTGFQWLKTLESFGFGGILADEMGLGKTVQMIAFFASREKREHPDLVVCPASLILNWGEELEKFAPELKVSLILGTAAERRSLIAEAADRDVWVTSYELLRQDVERYQDLTFDCCVLDEGQHIKNQSTLASKAVKTINCRQRFVLTGTPVENRLSELWNLFDFLMPGYLFSHSAFVEKLEKPIVKSKNPEASGQLQRLVQPFMLRRMKQEVLKELPPKIEHIRRIPLSETEQKTYYAAVNAAKSSLGDGGKLQILAALTQLRQVCCDPGLCFENYNGPSGKLEACLELCAGMVENGHQILLFSQFTSMLERIRQRLDKMGISSYTLQGSTPKEKRAQLVRSFNAGGASVFLISLKAGGTGLNLTAADVVIHYDPWWNLAAQNQATDRAHRMGQTAHVQVYKLIAQGTIEEKILELQDRKAQLMELVAGENTGGILTMSREELLALLD
ncbi:MAG: SNF2 helicase associated domain-containing protein [Faecousia sp.]